MHEDISTLQKEVSNWPQASSVIPHCQVVSFGLLSVCPLVRKLVCLAGTCVFCSHPFKLFPFLLILRILCSQNSHVCMKRSALNCMV